MFPVLVLTDRLITKKWQVAERFKKVIYLLYLLTGFTSLILFVMSGNNNDWFLVLLLLSVYYCISRWKDLRREKIV